MKLMFWKKESATKDSEGESQERLLGRTGSPRSANHESRDQEISEDLQGGTAEPHAAKSERRLFIGAAIGMLILALTGLTAWKLFPHSAKQNTTITENPALSQPIPLPDKPLIKLPSIEIAPLRKIQHKDPEAGIENLRKDNDALQTQIASLRAQLPQLERAQAEQTQANIDALAKKNNELQTQIDALTKKQQQQPPASPTQQTGRKVQIPLRGGDIAISNADPKATAKTLKEAIEAMNAGSAGPAQKTGK